MRKISVLTFLFSLILIVSCGNNTIETKSDSKSNVVEVGKPEHLTLETFKEKIMDFEANPQEWVYKGSEPAIIDFYADWCKPCKLIAPIMEELSKEYEGKIKIYKIDTQTERELASVFQIRSIPAVMFIPLEGKPMMQTGAMQKEAYVKIIEESLLKSKTTEK